MMQNSFIVLPLLLRIIIGDILCPILTKHHADNSQGADRLVVMFFFALVFAIVAVLLTGHFVPAIPIFLCGIVNSFAAFAHWQAVKINMTKTSACEIFDDIVAISLAALFLNELGSLSAGIVSGGVLCLAGSAFFAFKNRREPQENSNLLWFWIGLYSVIWGFSAFLLRFYAVGGELPVFSFALNWYSGSCLGAIGLSLATSGRIVPNTIPRSQIFWTVVLSFFIWSTLLTGYWALQLFPVVVLQPLLQASGIVFPVLLGLFVFKEGKKLSRFEKAGVALCSVGGCLIAGSVLK